VKRECYLFAMPPPTSPIEFHLFYGTHYVSKLAWYLGLGWD